MPGWPAMPPAPDPPPGSRLALVVATSTYTDPGLRQLRAPARDADDLAQVLADPGIGDFTVEYSVPWLLLPVLAALAATLGAVAAVWPARTASRAAHSDGSTPKSAINPSPV